MLETCDNLSNAAPPERNLSEKERERERERERENVCVCFSVCACVYVLFRLPVISGKTYKLESSVITRGRSKSYRHIRICTVLTFLLL